MEVDGASSAVGRVAKQVGLRGIRPLTVLRTRDFRNEYSVHHDQLSTSIAHLEAVSIAVCRPNKLYVTCGRQVQAGKRKYCVNSLCKEASLIGTRLHAVVSARVLIVSSQSDRRLLW